MKQRILLVINYINLFSALLLTASSVYYYPVYKFGLYLFFLSYFVELFLEKKWLAIKLEKKHYYFVALSIFFLLAFLYIPFEETSKYTVRLIEKRALLFGFALVGFFGVNKKYKLNFFLNTFIISSIVAIIYLLFFRIGIAEYISNPLRSEVFKIARMEYVNSHMVFNFYLNISLISCWYILTRTWSRTIWWKNYMYIGALTLIISMLSLSEGRSGFLVGILLILCFLFYEIWKRRKVVGIIIGLAMPLLFLAAVSQHQRMDLELIKNEPRFFLWESAISVIKENPLLGNGISDAQVKFDLARSKFQTEEYRLSWKDSKHLDSHNQFLQTTMEFGIFGLLLLLFLLIYPIFVADFGRKLFTFFIVLLCGFQSFFDMFLTGPFALLFGLLLLVSLTLENNIVRPNRK